MKKGRTKSAVKFALGDLVQLNKFWENRIGIVKADDTAWYLIRGHYDIGNCIAKGSDVVRVIVKGAVKKGYLKYV